jgi:UPF0716 protein FxsA
MPFVKWGLIGLILLPLAEVAAFAVIASLIGWFWTFCLFIATSVLGLALLRRSGRRDIDRLRDAWRRNGLRAMHLESPGVGPMLGGILLAFPGFITDALGLLLLVPAVRRRLRARATRAADSHRQQNGHRRQNGTTVVDLTPKEWRQVSNRPLK